MMEERGRDGKSKYYTLGNRLKGIIMRDQRERENVREGFKERKKYPLREREGERNVITRHKGKSGEKGRREERGADS